MKKFVLAVITVMVTASLFVSCSKTGTCEGCQKENVKIKKYTITNPATGISEEHYYCSDCKDNLKQMGFQLK